MQIITDYNNCPEVAKGAVIALGNFDGIHKGHQAIIRKTVQLAKDLNKPSAVMTFEPHPVSLFKPDTDNFRLTTFAKKAELIAALGVDYIFSVDFTRDFSKITAHDFVQNILVNSLKVSHVVIGYDFIFGYKRGGTSRLLQEMAEKYAYGFTQVMAVGRDDNVYSSTKIRSALQDGDLEAAKDMLGHYFCLSGNVIKGEGRGRTIGFPTVNVNCGDLLRPKKGVYAVKLKIENDDKIYDAVANIGVKPTFGGADETVEVHIFDFDRDIYSSNVEIIFIGYIRPEQKFSGVGELVEQINKDCIKAKEIHLK